MSLKVCGAAMAALTLSACSSMPMVQDPNPVPVQAPIDGAPPAPKEKSPEGTSLNLTPYIGVTDQLAGQMAGMPNDTYVRLTVRGFSPTGATLGTGTQEDRKYETRGWLARYLFGIAYGVHLNAKITVTPDPKIETTIPLVSLTHDSNTDVGEVWYTSLLDSDQPLPYFRVRSSTKLSAAFEFKRSSDVSSVAIKTAMSVIREAANAIAPGSNVVTHLSKEAVKQRTDVYDKALGKLFSTSITEHRTSAAPSRSWAPGKGYSVSLRMPATENSLVPHHPVGTWEITLTEPVVSVYIPEEIRADQTRNQAEAAVMRAVKPNEILNYKVSEQVSVYGYLASQDWFTSAVATIAADGEGAGDAAGQLCQKVVGSLDGLLLNDLDARLGLWAVTQGMAMPSKVVDTMSTSAKCQGYINPIMAVRS